MVHARLPFHHAVRVVVLRRRALTTCGRSTLKRAAPRARTIQTRRAVPNERQEDGSEVRRHARPSDLPRRRVGERGRRRAAPPPERAARTERMGGRSAEDVSKARAGQQAGLPKPHFCDRGCGFWRGARDIMRVCGVGTAPHCRRHGAPRGSHEQTAAPTSRTIVAPIR